MNAKANVIANLKYYKVKSDETFDDITQDFSIVIEELKYANSI